MTPCAAKACPHPGRHRVRARLGSRFASSIDVCDIHYRLLDEAGELEDSVPDDKATPCIWPDCGAPSRRGSLCGKHLQRIGKMLGHHRISGLTREELDQAILRWRVEAGEVPALAPRLAPVEEDHQPAVPPVAVPADAKALALALGLPPRCSWVEMLSAAASLVARVKVLEARRPLLLDAMMLVAEASWDDILETARRRRQELEEARSNLGRVARELKAEQDCVALVQAEHERTDAELRREVPAARVQGHQAGQEYAAQLIGMVLARPREQPIAFAELSQVPCRALENQLAAVVALRDELASLMADVARAEEALAPLVARYGTTSAGAIAACAVQDLARLDAAREQEGEGGPSPVAVSVLASWLHQDALRDEVVAAAIYAVADGLVPAGSLVEAMHDRVALARLVLGTRLPAPTTF